MRLAVAIVLLAALSFAVLLDREPRHPVRPERELPPGQKLRQLGDTPLKTGTRLWYRTNEASFGSVAATEQSHDFDDGTTQPRVFLRNRDGSQQWVPMQSLRKVLTE
jgi:hypothetical protein